MAASADLHYYFVTHFLQYRRNAIMSTIATSAATKPIASLFHLLLFSCIILNRKVSSSVAGQETLIAIKGQDFIILGADSSSSSSISLTSNNVDKIKIIIDPFPYNNNEHNNNSDNKRYVSGQQVVAVASAGNFADNERLIGNLIAHAVSMEYQHSLGSDVHCIYHGGDEADTVGSTTGTTAFRAFGGLDAETIAHLARGLIANSLRSRQGPLKSCLLIAGMTPLSTTAFHDNKSDDTDATNSYTSSNSSNISDQSFSKNLQRQVQAATDGFIKYHKQTLENEIHHIKLQDTLIKHPPPSKFLKPSLYWLDEYGSIQNVEYGAHGLASNFVLSILDQNYKSALSKEDAIQLIMNCFQQLRKRFVINNPEPPCIKCIDANGCTLIQVDESTTIGHH